jgi:hypothetical protein
MSACLRLVHIGTFLWPYNMLIHSIFCIYESLAEPMSSLNRVASTASSNPVEDQPPCQPPLCLNRLLDHLLDHVALNTLA